MPHNTNIATNWWKCRKQSLRIVWLVVNFIEKLFAKMSSFYFWLKIDRQKLLFFLKRSPDRPTSSVNFYGIMNARNFTKICLSITWDASVSALTTVRVAISAIVSGGSSTITADINMTQLPSWSVSIRCPVSIFYSSINTARVLVRCTKSYFGFWTLWLGWSHRNRHGQQKNQQN